MRLGETNTLKANRTTPQGCYLIDNYGEEVLLPNSYIPESLNLGDDIDVFIYRDNEQRLIATTLKPKLEVEQFAFLEIADANNYGAFADMGIVKQLLIPYREQTIKLSKGDKAVIYLMLDEKTDRLVGSTKINDFLFDDDITVKPKEQVELLIYKQTNLGYKAIINGMFDGLIFKSDVFAKINVGDKLDGYIKQIRPDGKIDLSLKPEGYTNTIKGDSAVVLDYLKKCGGSTTLTDKSDPHLIKEKVGLSKKAFKRALGTLYKNKIVALSKESTKLLK